MHEVGKKFKPIKSDIMLEIIGVYPKGQHPTTEYQIVCEGTITRLSEAFLNTVFKEDIVKEPIEKKEKKEKKPATKKVAKKRKKGKVDK